MKQNKPSTPLELLTNRELAIFLLIVQGRISQQIAEELFISIHTVNFHRKNIRSKLKLNSIGEMMQYAYKHQLM